MNKFTQALKIQQQQSAQNQMAFEGISEEGKLALVKAMQGQTKPLLPGDINIQEQQQILNQINEIESVLEEKDTTKYMQLFEKYTPTDILLFIETRLQGYGGLTGAIQMYKLRYCLEEKGINILFYAKPSLERSLIKSLLLDLNTSLGLVIQGVPFTNAMMKKIIIAAYEMDDFGWMDESDPKSVYTLIFSLKERNQKLFSEEVYLQIFNAWKQQYSFLIKEYGYDSETYIHLKEMKTLQQNFLVTNPDSIARIAQEEEKYKDQFDI